MRSHLPSLAILALLPAVALAAPVPLTLAHSGYLLDATDHAVTQAGVVVSFSIWDDVASTDPSHHVWPATPNACPVDVAAGYFTATLGGACAPGLTTAALPFGATRYLELVVGGVTLSPRLTIAATPTAGIAALALGTPDGAVTNAMLAHDSLTVDAGAGLTGGGPVALGGSTSLALSTLGSGGSFTNANVTIDTYGRVTAASNGAPGGITQILSGTGLTGGPITSTGTLAVDVGTSAGKIVQLDSSGRLPALNGSLLTNVVASSFSGSLTSAGSLTLGGALTLGYVTGTCGVIAYGTLRFDPASHVVEVCTAGGWTGLNVGRVTAVGGETTDITVGPLNYRVHTFRTVGTSALVVSGVGTVEVLVVGGGGGGGSDLGGGGGAGGYRYNAAFAVTALSYQVTVGGGGQGGQQVRLNNSVGGDGQPSVFGSITAAGGGGGGAYGNSSATFQNGRTGGSAGGGGAGDTSTTGLGGTAIASPVQGNGGGQAIGAGPYTGGGGGGAGGAGANATTTVGGAGGVGLSNDISGTSVTYAGGGGGSSYGSSSGTVGGVGGAGGGGNGGYGALPVNSGSRGLNGTANTGGGGGGGSYTGSGPSIGGNGGSGVVIVRYRTN